VHVEANLDIQYTVGLATGVNTTFLSVGGNYTTDLSSFVPAFLDTVSYLQTVPHPPGVVTTSYGDNEESFARADAKKFCDGYMALTARGVSVLFAAGDGGVRGAHDVSSQCTNNTFIPVFPTTCPYGAHACLALAGVLRD
jgi:tripeptidyl-peptidase-1